MAAYHFAEVLRKMMRRPNHAFSAGLLSKLAGVPRATIMNWLEERVDRPRHWQDLVRVGDALRLNHTEINHLLQVAGYGSLHHIYQQYATPGDRVLLAPWYPALLTSVLAAHTAGTLYPLAHAVGNLTALKEPTVRVPELHWHAANHDMFSILEDIVWHSVQLNPSNSQDSIHIHELILAYADNVYLAAKQATAQGHYSQAIILHTHCMVIRRTLEDRPGIAASLFALGNLALAQGDSGQARQLLLESLQIRQQTGEQFGLSCIYEALGVVAATEGDYRHAREFYHKSLSLASFGGDQQGVILVQERIANLAG
jgi:tetratricopeptide (TPR) repeat protein